MPAVLAVVTLLPAVVQLLEGWGLESQGRVALVAVEVTVFVVAVVVVACRHTAPGKVVAWTLGALLVSSLIVTITVRTGEETEAASPTGVPTSSPSASADTGTGASPETSTPAGTGTPPPPSEETTSSPPAGGAGPSSTSKEVPTVSAVVAEPLEPKNRMTTSSSMIEQASPMPSEPTRISNGLASRDLMLGDRPATLLFGRLEEVQAEVARTSTVSSADSILATYPDRCVLTTLVAGAPGEAGAVYAQGVNVEGPGAWQGAEYAPPRVLGGSDTEFHQQLISPPVDVEPGAFAVGASATSNDSALGETPESIVQLEAVEGLEQTWSVEGAEVVCDGTS